MNNPIVPLSFYLDGWQFVLLDKNSSNTLFRFLSLKKEMKYVDMPYCVTKEESDNFLRHYLSKQSENIEAKWFVYNHSNELFALIGLSGVDYKHFFASQSCLMLPEKQNKGYMKTIMRLFNHYCFTVLDLHRLEAQIHVDNLPSIMLFQSLGYSLDGVMRENYFIDGVFSDSYCYSILAAEM